MAVPALRDVHAISRMKFRRLDATPDDPKVDPAYQTLIHVGPGAYRLDQIIRYFKWCHQVWNHTIPWTEDLLFELPWHDPSKNDGSLLSTNGWVGHEPVAYPPHITGKTSTKSWDACGLGYVAQLCWIDLTDDQDFTHSYLWDWAYDKDQLHVGIQKFNRKNQPIPGWTFETGPIDEVAPRILARWNLFFLEQTQTALSKEAKS